MIFIDINTAKHLGFSPCTCSISYVRATIRRFEIDFGSIYACNQVLCVAMVCNCDVMKLTGLRRFRASVLCSMVWFMRGKPAYIHALFWLNFLIILHSMTEKRLRTVHRALWRSEELSVVSRLCRCIRLAPLTRAGSPTEAQLWSPQYMAWSIILNPFNMIICLYGCLTHFPTHIRIGSKGSYSSKKNHTCFPVYFVYEASWIILSNAKVVS